MTATNANSEVEVPASSSTLAGAAPPAAGYTPIPLGATHGQPGPGPAAILRGNAKGLEIVVDSRAPLADIVAALTARLGEAPAFFRGSDVRVRVEHGHLPPGTLARLDEIATTFELRIVEVGALVAPAPKAKATEDAIPRPNLAHGSAPADAAVRADDKKQADAPFSTEEDTFTRAPLGLPATELIADAARARTVDITGRRAESVDDLEDDTFVPTGDPALDTEPAISRAITQEMSPIAAVRTVEFEAKPTLAKRAHEDFPRVVEQVHDELLAEPPTTRVVVGPVRSGVILDHPGHLVVFGDVNPGAEIRAEGNIVILGRLRGTAHAGIGNDSGFILALRLEPQQLRICRQVARAGDSDTPGTEAEIAYVTDASIVVERYAGRLPKNLAASI